MNEQKPKFLFKLRYKYIIDIKEIGTITIFLKYNTEEQKKRLEQFIEEHFNDLVMIETGSDLSED